MLGATAVPVENVMTYTLPCVKPPIVRTNTMQKFRTSLLPEMYHSATRFNTFLPSITTNLFIDFQKQFISIFPPTKQQWCGFTKQTLPSWKSLRVQGRRWSRSRKPKWKILHSGNSLPFSLGQTALPGILVVHSYQLPLKLRATCLIHSLSPRQLCCRKSPMNAAVQWWENICLRQTVSPKTYCLLGCIGMIIIPRCGTFLTVPYW